ncbi:molybdenum cofactor sulfurase [Melia azedarach]|uniref:Molybdenum cofactor sulfurase n=1 Tax=Melia azedarach TaxID=155640 RepID=A0ACC1X4S4_MELAZ|nr:molybdenum cofactor sulfurase [Melia azedarach]
MQSPCLKEVSQVCPHGCCPSPFFCSPQPLNKVSKSRSTSADYRRDFAATTTSSIFPNAQFTNHESLPSLQQSFTEFTKAYPQYSDTYHVDQIRAKEYFHLSLPNHTCLDYFGIGLFSYNQLQKQDSSTYQIVSSSSPLQPSSPSQNLDIPFFSVSYKTGNLKTQLLHGGQESELELAMKKKIMHFLNISENDYSMVFTANRTSAFNLLAESYPYQSSRKLLTVYDYESEAVDAMINTSEKRGARVMSAEFSWPRLRINSAKMRKMLVSKRKKKKHRGLFVFPIHSRMTGARYPYLWMRIAQENGWHILIDACALGPKDMDSFGLSLFRPDFLICSFYKIFGENPSGFGCLFVKKSTVPVLEADTSTGMVHLLPAKKQSWLMEEFSSSETELEQTSKFKLQEEEVAASNSFLDPMSVEMVQSGKLEQGETSEVQKTEITAQPIEMGASKAVDSGKLADFIRDKNAKTNTEGSSEIECRGLEQVDSLGLTVISTRARCLINWLVNALLKLQHPNTEGITLVKIYGPKIKFDRGPALAFNVFDWKGEKTSIKERRTKS